MRTPDSEDPSGDGTGGSLSGGSGSLAEGFGGTAGSGDSPGSGDGGDAFGTGSSGDPGGEPSSGGGILDVFGLRGDDASGGDPSGDDASAAGPLADAPPAGGLAGPVATAEPAVPDGWDLTGDGTVDHADFEASALGLGDVGGDLDGDPAASPGDHDSGFFDS